MKLNNRKQVFYVVTDAELRNEHYRRRLIMVLFNLRMKKGNRMVKVHRRDWVKLLKELDQDICFHEIEPRFPGENGRVWEMPLPEDLIKDPDARNLSNILKRIMPWETPPLPRSLDLLRAMDLVVRIRWPRLAKLIAR